ncbi:MFS transporter [Amycolatopsis sp. NPDC051758]|uniref:MFS transporter n=1 Tax=Amycolatopsis sp. NPDC051758 TaxID=3363935 RepID=UPI00379ACCC1
MDTNVAEEQVRSRRAGPRRPGWTTADWWRSPVSPIYLAGLVLSLGRGAWFTCWAMFFIRSVGLTPAQFGFGVTAAGIVGMVVGGPLGYLSDRIGSREVLVGIGVVQGAAIFSYTFIHDFWLILLATCLVTAGERSAPGIRIAAISGLTTGEERLSSISTARVVMQVGTVVGALVGGFVLSLDTRTGYATLLGIYGALHVFCALLLAFRLPHVTSLADRKVKRRTLVLRDRPFLVITGLNGVLALNWGMVDPGIPLWISHHTHAPLWIWAVVVGISAGGTVLFQNRFSRWGATVSAAAKLGMWSGIALAASCVVFAFSHDGAGLLVVGVLILATLVYLVGELLFVGSGFGLSVGLTPEGAHGEYQGVFGTGQAAAMMLAPGIMTLLLVEWSVAGWFVLAAVYLLGGFGTLFAGRWALRDRERELETTA